MAYTSEAEAAFQAKYTLVRYQQHQAPYKCSTCNFWHLASKMARALFETCSYCHSRDGNYKLTYPDINIAERRAEALEATAGKIMRPYECPHGEGWHLTSIR